MRQGEFVISLDFELLWGVRDRADRTSYGANVLGARKAIPQILDLFAKYDISATWATVGFLMCESKDELIDVLPPKELRPEYRNRALSSYSYLGEVGENEGADPYYFAPSLVRMIADAPRQEIGTHTLSHFYCLEPGSTVPAFDADLQAALTLARRRGIEIRSIVFARNQYSQLHLEACRRLGVQAYRGNPPAWAYSAAPGADQTLPRRGMRLLDAHTGLLGSHAYEIGAFNDGNVPASSFLRPHAGSLRHLYPLHSRNIRSGMSFAAEHGRGYHLWWHPHNFGTNTSKNIAGLRVILEHFSRLRDAHGMTSRSMFEAARHR